MTELYNVNKAVRITRFLNCERVVNVNRITNQALDGTTYLQIVGTPTVDFKAICWVDRVGKAAMETAEAEGSLLRLTCKHGTYYGRITSASYGERQAADWFQVTLTLAMEGEP